MVIQEAIGTNFYVLIMEIRKLLSEAVAQDTEPKSNNTATEMYYHKMRSSAEGDYTWTVSEQRLQ